MFYFILFLVILCISIVLYFSRSDNKIIKKGIDSKDPCTDYLSDNEYLEHMIPHHQVGIDMSEDLIKVTKNPTMISLCRGIIWEQGYEIQMMKSVMNKLPHKSEKNKLKDDQNNLKNYSFKTKLHFYEPKLSKATDYYCDPKFFNPQAHDEHIKHINKQIIFRTYDSTSSSCY